MSAGLRNADHEQVSSATVQAGEPMIVKEMLIAAATRVL
jgi:hypothetical protein